MVVDAGTQFAAAVNTTYRTNGFAQYGEQADAEITKIIEQNEMESPAKTAKAAATKVAMGN